MSFVHLHTHSDYSLLDGAAKVRDLVRLSREMEMPALALTDHGNMFGAIEFYQEALKAGIKPIIGIEIYMAPGKRQDRNVSAGIKDTSYHLVLLAKDEAGYHNLIKLSSLAYLEGFYYRPRIDWELLEKYHEGLICLTACLKGQIPQLLLQNRVKEAEATTARMKELFNGDFYLEVQNHGINDEAIALNALIELGKKLDLKLVATNDVHYLRKEHDEAHDALLCIQSGKTLADPQRLKFSGAGYHLRSPQEMEALFRDMPETLEITLEVAEKCNLELSFGKQHFPAFPIPSEEGSSADEYFEKISWAGLKQRYPEPSQEAVDRLKHEIAIIRQLGFSGYFLVVKDFVDFAREHKIPVGPGRGSAAGSLVAYSLRITNIDPLKYDLLFERFLNPERVSPPDIDIDFADNRRGEVIDYVRSKYGDDSVTQIITFGKMLARAVVRDVGRVMGIPYSEVDRLAKLIPPILGITLERTLDEAPEFRSLVESNPDYGKLISISKVLEGVHRNASTHAAGVVIAPGDLQDYVPLFKAAETGETTTQWDMKWLDTIGLLKMDFLGLRTLTVIDDTLTALRNKGIDLNIDDVPLNDPDTFKLFAEKGTVGIFQFESSGMKENLARLQPQRLHGLIAMNALYRPGPMEMISTYIARRHGQEEISYLHPLLKPILEETYGIIVYQEQVIRIASDVAGFSLGKSDILRRAMGKKKIAEMQRLKGEFIQGAKDKGINEKISSEIYDYIERFASYGFNKSHSAGYALVAYQTAYLKAHHTAEFLAACLTSEMNDSDRILLLVDECQRLDIPVYPPDVNRSYSKFTVEDDGIRFGLGAIKHSSVAAVNMIVEAREDQGAFRSLYDIVERVDGQKVNRKVLESLIQAGACDSLEGHRAQMKAALDDVLRYGQQMREEKSRGQESLFDVDSADFQPPSPLALPEVEPWSSTEMQILEKDALGFFLSTHPLEPYRLEVASFSHLPFSEMDQAADSQPVRLIGYISDIRRLTDKNGRPMAFVTLVDFTGSLELIFFSDALEKLNSIVVKDATLVVTGRCSTRENEAVKVIAEDAFPLETARSRLAKGIEIQLDRNENGPDLAERIERLCTQHPGNLPLYIRLTGGENGDRQYLAENFQLKLGDHLIDSLEKLVGQGNVHLVARGNNGSSSNKHRSAVR
ncbi:DNA polymerase III subunit alpha [candidate division LCP-89 bacterium B3_LCP]|uniref:DNA polymerase III subunit alpha n=1 Tax=candidate division LCP-89 bacterium B3_LCP TaxID=2012998 RepID=A0A532UYB7_UNCL8|nr:MAG: DNA polymerase III subunit alpha [candidate division LCP-89 bacterium B3_LCP]